MNHRVAVWTDRPEFLDWVDGVVLFEFGQRLQVVHVNVAGAPVSVSFLRSEAADRTLRAVVPDASLTRGAVSFVAIHLDPVAISFRDTARADLVGSREMVFVQTIA